MNDKVNLSGQFRRTIQPHNFVGQFRRTILPDNFFGHFCRTNSLYHLFFILNTKLNAFVIGNIDLKC